MSSAVGEASTKPLTRVRSLGLKRQPTDTTSRFSSSDNAIVYDPSRQKLLKDWIETVEGDDQYIRVPLKGRKCNVDIYIEVGDEKTQVFLATVDLTRLGKNVKWLRKTGKIDRLYVLGQVRDGWSRVRKNGHASNLANNQT